MTGFAGRLQDQAVGKTEGRSRAEQVERGGNGVRVLKREVFVIEQHVNFVREFARAKFVCGPKDPRSLRDRDNRSPHTLLNNSVGGSGLAGIVSDDQANK